MQKFIIEDWHRVLMVSYSSWFQLAGIMLLLLPEALFAWAGVDLNPSVIWKLGLAFLVGGWVGRFIKQEQAGAFVRRTVFYGFLIALGVWAAPVLAFERGPVLIEPEPAAPAPVGDEWSLVAPEMVPLVAKWEGKHPCPDNRALHCSYFDQIAKPPLWTVGYGHTETAERGQRWTEERARDQLARDTRRYWRGWRDVVTVTPPHLVQAVFGSLTYNIGIGAARKSTATRRLNAGDSLGACDAIGWWNKAGGRVVRGLVNRRAEEVAKCKAGFGLAS